MKLTGSGGQTAYHPMFDASGTITTGGTAQLVLGRSISRSQLILGNNSNEPMWVEFGAARATATLTSGTVTTITVANAGFGYTYPPLVRFFGGGYNSNSTFIGLAQPGSPGPDHQNGFTGRPARAHAVLTAGAVSSIVIDDGGSGYAVAPMVFLLNSDLDPNGAALPVISSSTGLHIPSGSSPIIFNGTACTTDQIAIVSATTGSQFTCKWMD